MVVGRLSLLFLCRDSEAAVGGLAGRLGGRGGGGPHSAIAENRAAAVAMERVCGQASVCEQCHVEHQNVFEGAAPLRPSLVGKVWAHRRAIGTPPATDQGARAASRPLNQPRLSRARLRMLKLAGRLIEMFMDNNGALHVHISARMLGFFRCPLISRQTSPPMPFQCPISSSSRRRLTKLDFRVSTNHTLLQYNAAKPTNTKLSHNISSTVPPCLICTPTVSLIPLMALANTAVTESAIAAVKANVDAIAGQSMLK